MSVQKLGIRMALGAQRGDILRMVLWKGLRFIAAGAVIGLLLSFALTRFLASLLWGVSPTDSWTFGAALSLIVVAGAAACILPARKATRVDPLIAIRCE